MGGARVAVVAAAERAGVAGRSRCPFLLLLSVGEVLCRASLGPPLTWEQGLGGRGMLSGTIGPPPPVFCGVFILPHSSLVLF